MNSLGSIYVQLVTRKKVITDDKAGYFGHSGERSKPRSWEIIPALAQRNYEDWLKGLHSLERTPRGSLPRKSQRTTNQISEKEHHNETNRVRFLHSRFIKQQN